MGSFAAQVGWGGVGRVTRHQRPRIKTKHAATTKWTTERGMQRYYAYPSDHTMHAMSCDCTACTNVARSPFTFRMEAPVRSIAWSHRGSPSTYTHPHPHERTRTNAPRPPNKRMHRGWQRYVRIQLPAVCTESIATNGYQHINMSVQA